MTTTLIYRNGKVLSYEGGRPEKHNGDSVYAYEQVIKREVAPGLLL